MTDLETRADELLDRLADCGLGDGMNEDDLLAASAREPLRSCCIALAGRLWAVCQVVNYGDPKALQAATVAVRRAADTEAAAGDGRLDAALTRLAQAVDPSFAASSSRLEAVELITAVLQAATMAASAADREQPSGEQPSGCVEMLDADEGQVESAEDMDTTDSLAVELSAALRAVANLLQLHDAVACPTAAQAVVAVQQRLAQLLAQLPAGFFEPLLSRGALDAAQLAILEEADAALRSEYSLRRRMLVERAKVTLQSLLWSPHLEQQGTKVDAQAVANAAVRSMVPQPSVAALDVFGATLADLLAILEKATSGETGIHASVKGVIIGKVPDRGGRPEGRRREADMPAWTDRKVTQGGGGGRRQHGGGRGRGGGRVQGSWQGGDGSGGRGGKARGKGGEGWGASGKGKLQI